MLIVLGEDRQHAPAATRQRAGSFPGRTAQLRHRLVAAGNDDFLTGRQAVPFGPIRVDRGQQAMAMAIHSSPDGSLPEPGELADRLCEDLHRFVPLIEL